MKIQVDNSAGALMDTLLKSDAIRRHSKPVLHRDPVPAGQMGADGGWVELALAPGLNITAIVVSVAAWIRPRQPIPPTPKQAGKANAPKVTALIQCGDTEVLMSDASAETVAKVIRALEGCASDD